MEDFDWCLELMYGGLWLVYVMRLVPRYLFVTVLEGLIIHHTYVCIYIHAFKCLIIVHAYTHTYIYIYIYTYIQVDPEGIKSGLEGLIEGGTPARFLILDDGWQSTDTDEAYRYNSSYVYVCICICT